MGFLDRSFERRLGPSEALRWSGTASRTVRRKWVGGRVFVTNRALYFRPGLLARLTDETLRVPVSTVVSVSVIDRTGTLYDGGMRRRVRVVVESGKEHLFAMPHIDRRAAEIRALTVGNR